MPFPALEVLTFDGTAVAHHTPDLDPNASIRTLIKHQVMEYTARGEAEHFSPLPLVIYHFVSVISYSWKDSQANPILGPMYRSGVLPEAR